MRFFHVTSKATQDWKLCTHSAMPNRQRTVRTCCTWLFFLLQCKCQVQSTSAAFQNRNPPSKQTENTEHTSVGASRSLQNDLKFAAGKFISSFSEGHYQITANSFLPSEGHYQITAISESINNEIILLKFTIASKLVFSC